MDKLKNLKELLLQHQPVAWDSLPDIGLYMDQVLSYLPRQHAAYRSEDQLTASMVNNYIKEGLLERARSKKYTREHLVMLTAISQLKQVLPVKDVDSLLKETRAQGEPRAFYERYNAALDSALQALTALLPEDADAQALSEAALRLAVASYANKLACERLLDLLRSEKTGSGQPSPAKT